MLDSKTYSNSFFILKWLLALCFIIFFLLLSATSSAQKSVRADILLDADWRTTANDTDAKAFDGFELSSFSAKNWKAVNVPHNWDAYEGYRRMRHGNRHGYAWYRKTFIAPLKKEQRYFLFFEGVGSYATVWLNGKKVGFHAGGRTTFTLDVTDAMNKNGQPNLLAVRADHPANIQDLPWVCGGCSDERGFSEGSQPMGIFRPVHLIITAPVRIQPFGVHLWNDTTVSEKSASVFLETEIKNYGNQAQVITILNKLIDKNGKVVATVKASQKIEIGATIIIAQKFQNLQQPHLWSLENPYLYNLVSELWQDDKLVDQTTTPYGIRYIQWPLGRPANNNQFLLNGKPVFINGIAEYEHELGSSHAFSDEQIRTRVAQVKAAGFNAFRDAHQPHNLRYQENWDSLGILWWTQMSAHIWYDTPAFRSNFKSLLTDWVKERRNSPSIILWGLQNESKLPEDFARECTALIRQLDPTASSQRLVTTCNGGTGTDWDVPQNWTGTYGGDPALYAQDIQRQTLVGEYGAWRTLDVHNTGELKPATANYSEDRMVQLLELKMHLSDSVKNKTAGHFMWLLTSHDNPGRVQGGEGYREIDRIGPVNYKGLLTPWEEPLDAFYLYRSNYASKVKEPMVYIVSHTWPDRWNAPGIKDSIIIYSNCDEVELFNDVDHLSLGKRKRQGVGTHFQWDDVPVKYNILYAVGYVGGKAVAKDYITLRQLPKAPHYSALYTTAKNNTTPAAGYHYLYRVNCGGNTYTDVNGNTWNADRHKTHKNTWGSLSWTDDFAGMPPFFASQRVTTDPITNTPDELLFQSFRYGRDKLRFSFPVPDGEYLVELYFIEPWIGRGGGLDGTGWRLFDVAINNKTVLKNVDIWKEAGLNKVLKKTVIANVSGGQLVVSFPQALSGQAVISAIAIATKNKTIKPAPASPSLINNLGVTDKTDAKNWTVADWLDAGDKPFTNDVVSYTILPPNLYSAAWLQVPRNVNKNNAVASFKVSSDADVFIGIADTIAKPKWLQDFEATKTTAALSDGTKLYMYRKRFSKEAVVTLGASGTMYTVSVLPTTTIEPAYDLKPVVNYKAVAAQYKGSGIAKAVIDGKERVLFQKAAPGNIVEWQIAVGVADTYSFTISYGNAEGNTAGGKLQLLAADGTLLKEEVVNFTTTKAGKMNYINSSTGGMINAGNYIVRLSSASAEGVNINSLDVQ